MIKTDQLTIRHALIDDIEAITNIYNQAVDEKISTFDEFHTSTDRYKAYLGEKTGACLIVAIKENELLGWASIDPISDRWAYRFTCLGSTYIKREYRGKRIGHLLKEQIFIEAKLLGYHSIIGEVLSTNIKSFTFNLDLGYKIVGQITEAGFRNSKWIDLIVIQKFLDD